MCRFILVIGSFLYTINCCGQLKGDYIWQIGSASNPHQNPYALSLIIDFNHQGILMDTFFRDVDMGYFNASISDDEGRLLAYSNGCQINDGEHWLIPGTKSLNPGSVDLEWCSGNFGYPVAGSGLFLSFYSDSIILLLHQRVLIEGPPTHVYIDSLYYTSVVRQDSNYILLDKTVPIIGDYLTDGNVEAVKSNKPGAWWVIQGERASNRYFTILLDSARVDTIYAQAIGDNTYRGGAAGQAVFSPDGSMYARYNPLDDLFLFDFDRETGLLSNYRKMHVADSGIIGGLAFSPNGRFLYACAQFDMYQFDTWAVDIEASKIHLGHYDGFFDSFPSTFYHMQLGPDCRIYIGTPNGIKVWHIIHEPDKKGLECRFEQHGFRFPVSNSITMPNFPNYRLDIAPACDPGLVTGSSPFWSSPVAMHVYPNPTTGEINLHIPDHSGRSSAIQVRIVSSTGQVCLEKKLTLTQGRDMQLHLDSLVKGIYFLHVTGADGFSEVIKLVIVN